MQSIARMALEPGMELAEDVITLTNGVIIKKDTIIDEYAIQKLKRYNIMCVSVKTEEDYATTHFEKVRVSKAFKNFEQVYANNLNAYKYMIDSFIQDGIPINIDYLLKLHDNVVACVKTREQMLDMLYNMLPTEDNMTYAHCFNSALISSTFGIWLAMNKEDIKTLTICGYLYDIGKLKLPNRILWKPDKLSDFEYNWMKTHTTIGYDLLKKMKIDEHILNATLMHHERADGSGYPSKLMDDKIDFFAKVIAIVDSYEAMTSARIYRASLNPFQVIADFEKTGFEKYNTFIISSVLKHIANDQLGMNVRLSNDITGTVILINEEQLSKPLIKTESDVFDLTANPDVSIVSVF